jgi:hypothetical protein
VTEENLPGNSAYFLPLSRHICLYKAVWSARCNYTSSTESSQ